MKGLDHDSSLRGLASKLRFSRFDTSCHDVPSNRSTIGPTRPTGLSRILLDQEAVRHDAFDWSFTCYLVNENPWLNLPVTPPPNPHPSERAEVNSISYRAYIASTTAASSTSANEARIIPCFQRIRTYLASARFRNQLPAIGPCGLLEFHLRLAGVPPLPTATVVVMARARGRSRTHDAGHTSTH